ncbi:uncharacterized protein LODBEIA_P14380 [Lodderomyces beijingensis]|uniref:K Homology domain-containing protein n=1 Tax=Lodderomyces beijingensis TaxID=1775926 RepID=A0ABP0ZGC6_9ASCO
MSTPAEIIAARVNRQDEGDYDYENEFVTESAEKSRNSTPSISDESAFPALGLKSSSNGHSPAPSSSTNGSNWGPKMKSPSSAPVSKSAVKKSAATNSSNGFAIKSKIYTIQEAFSLDIEDQLNVARPEFIKILTQVMQETKTNIECTNSQHTKKRTFLITGRPNEVKLAKRLVIKKLTKPVKIKFSIPAKLRSRVIGQGGKNLKPIISANEVKIEIGDEEEVNGGAKDEADSQEEEEDDIFSRTVQITIDGDVDGAKNAKNQILAIVKEETKNLSTKVALEDKVKPFAASALSSIVERYSSLDFSIPDYKSSRTSIVIVGDRENVLEAKSDVKAALEKLASKIVVEEVPIPKTKHQFLPVDKVLQNSFVLIQLPKEGEQNVKFVGEKKNIKAAQEEARKVTSQYKVEVLDMSKAHKGNLRHVKAVAVLLNKTGAFKQIAQANDVIIHVPTAKELQDESVCSIPIEIVSKGEDDKIKLARKAIVNQVNKITPEQTKIITDIDLFFMNRVDETIKEVAKADKVSYVILGNSITLFSSPESGDDGEADDFDDVETTDFQAFDKVDAALNELRELTGKLTLETIEDLSPKEISIVSGPKGTTLKSILAAVGEPHSVTVKLSHEEPASIVIHGLKTSVAHVKKDIEAVLAEAKEYPEGFTATVQVPAQVVSRLIGRNGASLNTIRDEFGVKIDVPVLKNGGGAAGAGADHLYKKDDNEKVDITINGVKKNVEEAKASIAASAKKWADETLARLRIEHQYHRRMIGSQGVYINRLQDKYNVKIRFPSADASAAPSTFADAPKSKDEVTIKGPSKGVAKAEEELKELYQFEKENGFKQVVQIPSKAISRVIGKNGGTINDIADGSGVEYKFKREKSEEEKTGFAEVELTGAKSALKEAVAKIQDIISDVENFVVETIKVDPQYHRDLVGPYGSVMKSIIHEAGGDDLPRNKYNRLLAIPNEGSGSDEIVCQGDKSIVSKIVAQIEKLVEEKKATVVEEVELAKEKHRFVIGAGGSVRSEIERECKVNLSIPKRDDQSNLVKVKGLPENIEKAKAKIIELTKDKEVKNGGAKKGKAAKEQEVKEQEVKEE